MTRIGFFGGTFDPIHNGHLNLATSLLERHQLDQILFCPANISPAKHNTPPISSNQHRKKMVELAIERADHFQLCDLELKRKGPSFTIDTIKALKDLYPQSQLYLILGEDMLNHLDKWKEVGTLLQLAPPLVGTRPGFVESQLPPSLKEKIKPGLTPIHPMEISSTELRERLEKKMFCDHLIPSKVLDFIEGNRLY